MNTLPQEFTTRMDELLLRLRRLDNRPVGDHSQSAFDRLPGLISRQLFLEWSGLDKNQLHELVHDQQLSVYRPEGRTTALYYKHELARLIGMKL